jgi:hypothetical protein
MADVAFTSIEIVTPGRVAAALAADAAFVVGDIMLTSGSQYIKADASDTSKLSAEGICINAGATGEYPVIIGNGGVLEYTGATLTKGESYYLSGLNAGKLGILSDVGTGDSVIRIGVASSTTRLQVDIRVPSSAITL